MEPISNVDRLVLLLRQQLQARDRTRAGRRAGAARSGKSDKGGVSAAHALAALEGVDDRQLRRALIQGLLVDQFGEKMLNDPKFQQVVDRVTAAIEADVVGRELLGRIGAQFRTAPQ